jgi:hypothetical protein
LTEFCVAVGVTKEDLSHLSVQASKYANWRILQRDEFK